MLSARAILEVESVKGPSRALVLVHPGSLAGSYETAHDYDPRWQPHARARRSLICDKFHSFPGERVVVLGSDLDDEIDSVPVLARAVASAHQSFSAAPDEASLRRVARQILAALPSAQEIEVTGCWCDEPDGCAWVVFDELRRGRGVQVTLDPEGARESDVEGLQEGQSGKAWLRAAEHWRVRSGAPLKEADDLRTFLKSQPRPVHWNVYWQRPGAGRFGRRVSIEQALDAAGAAAEVRQRRPGVNIKVLGVVRNEVLDSDAAFKAHLDKLTGRRDPGGLGEAETLKQFLPWLAKQDRRTETVRRLAAEFSKNLRQYLNHDDMQTVIFLNRNELDDTVCHSHDFCDANVLMDEAFKTVTGKPASDDFLNDAVSSLWNDAWNLAKVSNFRLCYES